MTRTTKRQTIGDRAAAARAALGVEPIALARALRWPLERLSAIEAGEAPDPSELVALADLLGRTVRELEQGPLVDLAEDKAATAKFRISRRQSPGRTPTTEDPAERAAISRNLRIYREALGLSQSEVSRAIGIASPSVVNTHEQGTKGVSAENLERYAALFRCTVEDLKRPATVVVRAKLAGDVADLSDERRAAFQQRLLDFERRMTGELQDAIAAEHARQKRRR